MSLESLLALVVEVLGDAGVPYMLTGSLSGSYHGAPRADGDTRALETVRAFREPIAVLGG